ncbi:MAG: molybdopterin-dependent oxidoreductase [Acidimicrobiia bacterium]
MGSNEGTPVGRRVVLGMLAAGVGGVLFGSRAASLMERVVAPLSLRDGTGLLSLFPVGRFRFYSVTGPVPPKSEADYRLSVGGSVATPVTLTLADLRALPATRLTEDFVCVTGWRVHDVRWKGVRLAEVLERAGVAESARGVLFRSFDGLYTETLSLAQARRDDVIVAYEMEGGPVIHDHGGPVRLYCAPMFGYKSIKWLDRIEVTDADPGPGYWAARGYDIDGWLPGAKDRVDRPG